MKIAFYCLGFALSFCSAHAQQGMLDPSFGNGKGYVFIPGPSAELNTAYAVVIQPDGKILTAGQGSLAPSGWVYFQVTRQNTDGTMDPSFGTNGIVSLHPSEIVTDGASSPAFGMALQPDGKIVVVGRNQGFHNFAASTFSTAIIRLNTNGSLDNSFAGDGKLNLQLSSSNSTEGANEVVLQPDGKIVIAGVSTRNPIGNTMTIARINSDGTPDNSFNITGVRHINFATASEGFGVKLQPDGKIVAAGRVTGTGSIDVAVVRLLNDGSYDNSFDGDGKASFDINGTDDFGYSLDLQADGKIVIGGSTQGATTDMLFVRLNTDGSLDNSFNITGKKIIDLGFNEMGYRVIVQTDGKILLGGRQNTALFQSYFFVTKLNNNGTEDQSFGTTGTAIHISGGSSWAQDITLQEDGKIVVAGYGGKPLEGDGKMVARLTNAVSTQTSLPVLLSSFTLKHSGSGSLLEWSTASEQNSDRFEIEHSLNGRDFKMIAFVGAAGNSDITRNYSWMHTDPSSGWNYYRLRQVDLDGKFAYSTIQKINNDRSAMVQLWPNRGSNFIKVKHGSTRVTDIMVTDMQGKTVMRSKAGSGSETILNISSLHPGMYIVSVYHDGESTDAKFVKE
jgi:uncharacterized delta-60 repeat protein